MDGTSLTGVTEDLLARARASRSGRAAQTVYGGQEHGLRQTVIALAGQRELAAHESPGEVTLLVLTGRVRLTVDGDDWEGLAGDFVAIPQERHSLAALEDAAVLLSVRVGP